MHTAVNTRLLQHAPLDGIGRFSFEILRRVAANHPQDLFTLLFDRRFDGRYLTSKNMKGKWVPPPTRLPFLMDLFFEVGVPIALKRLKPNVFFSPDGWVSMSTKTPTVQVVHDLNFIHMPEHLPSMWRKYYLERFPLFIEKADHIITVSEFSKRDLMKELNVPESKISVVYNETADGFRPAADFGEMNHVQARFADGKPYFLFVGLIHQRKNITGLMQAFALFKAQTGSDARLVIAGSKKWWTEELEETFIKNPYKTDIIFTGRVSDEDLQKIYRGALALVYPSFFEGFGIPILEAFKSDVPVITSNNTALPEVGGNAALYCDPYLPESIAEQMKALHNDKDLRDLCIRRGRLQAQKFSWDTGAETVGQILHRYA
jgi:glycosyltransferase involved in cell wall biosynthesis